MKNQVTVPAPKRSSSVSRAANTGPSGSCEANPVGAMVSSGTASAAVIRRAATTTTGRWAAIQVERRSVRRMSAAPAHHFGDKEGLLTAYAVQGFVALRDALASAGGAASAAGQSPLGEIGLAYVRFAVAEPGRFSVMFRPEHVAAEHPDYREACDAAFGVLVDAVAQLRHELPAESSELLHAATGAWSIVHGFATLWLDGNLAEVITGDEPGEAAAATMMAFGATLFAAAGVPADAVPTDHGLPGTMADGGVGQAIASSSDAEESPDSAGQDAG